MQTFLKIFSTMANWLRNALLILHYPTVIFTVFSSYLGTVLTKSNKLIRDILKEIEMQIKHNVQFPFTKVYNLTNRKTIEFLKFLIKHVQHAELKLDIEIRYCYI